MLMLNVHQMLRMLENDKMLSLSHILKTLLHQMLLLLLLRLLMMMVGSAHFLGMADL